MEQQRTSTNEQPERVECPSCLLRLSLLQAQVGKSGKAAVLHQGTRSTSKRRAATLDFRTASFTS